MIAYPLLHCAAACATRYLHELNNRGVAPSAAAIVELESFDEPLPAQSTDPDIVLKMFHGIGSQATGATAGRRFFGLVIGGSLPVTLASNWLGSA